ncbi:37S ribosomal protein S9, mitochondrial [Ceratocystis pirilliformis]|uniref:Small ribosomal subunit protein uS9m n=1 Tax=Ceratocystis pirilliformis TaxID=259994 RepID=A0ABR3ZCM3_9PEZI
MAVFGLSARQLRIMRQLNRAPTQPTFISVPLSNRQYSSSASDVLEVSKPQKRGRQRIIEPDLDNAGRPKIKAAEPIALEKVRYARMIPASPGYFSRHPFFSEGLVELQRLVSDHRSLPRAPKSVTTIPVQWRTLEEYISVTREPIREVEYKQALGLCEELMKIHPSIMPDEVRLVLGKWKADVTETVEHVKPHHIDYMGRSLGVGKRKSSTARAWVIEGTGEVIINGKPITEAFGCIHDRESALWALHSTNRMDKYNVFAIVQGGGTTGQAEALALAVSKALLGHEPALKPALRRAGCVTQDSRSVERKKHGHVKARKMPAWVKR